MNSQGELILRREVAEDRKPDGFDAVLGTADIKWDTDELMALMRGGE